MKPKKAIMVFIIGLTLMSSGCSSLQPPAGDKAAWEEQQRQEIKRQESAGDPLGESLYWAYMLTAWLY
jgi:hypothetical protein